MCEYLSTNHCPDTPVRTQFGRIRTHFGGAFGDVLNSNKFVCLSEKKNFVLKSKQLQVSGRVTYNGQGMEEFVPERTAAYISQDDLHSGEMTVRETLAFSARCQGVGDRHGNNRHLLLVFSKAYNYFKGVKLLRVYLSLCKSNIKSCRR